MTTLNLTTTLAAELGNNNCAVAIYDYKSFPANFTGKTMVSQSGTMESVDSTKSDDSLNPVAPAHISPVSVHTLFPKYKGKIISLCVPYNFGGNHVNIGVNNNTVAQAKAAMLNEQMIGADGITIDWYGPNRIEDSISLLWKAQIESMSNFDFAIMIDSGSYSTTAQLQSYLAYLNTTYFPSKAYRTWQGKKVLYLWGTPVPGVDYVTALAPYNLYVITQGTSVHAWTSGNFDWPQPALKGVNPADPYCLIAKQSFIDGVKSSVKGCVLALTGRFNGMLTKTVAWSQGKMMPGDNGKCWIAQAGMIGANLLPNLVEILLATGASGDWEEGTQLATGIDNGITVSASLKGSVLSWSVEDESTISSYRVLAQLPGAKPNDTAILGTPAVGSKSLDLNTVTGWQTGTYQVYVVAVGIACVRNQASAAIAYTPVTDQTGTFVGTLTGTFVGTFTPKAS